MGSGFSYDTAVLLQQRSQWAAKAHRGQIEGREGFLRTFAVYKNLRAIPVGTHQYSAIVYLLVRQARLAVDDFE